MSNFVIGMLMMTGVGGLIGYIFYKASPLPKPDLHQAEIEAQRGR